MGHYQAAGRYVSWDDDQSPSPGDFLFVYMEKYNTHHTGIVVSVENGMITTIDGNWNTRPGSVCYNTFPTHNTKDRTFKGYGKNYGY